MPFTACTRGRRESIVGAVVDFGLTPIDKRQRLRFFWRLAKCASTDLRQCHLVGRN
jgi:hypothetical protein